MDALKRLLLTIGAGTILGRGLWFIANREGMNGGGWIIVGIILATVAWLTWGTTALVRSRTQQGQKPEPTIVTRYVTPPSDLDQLQARLKGHSITSFAAVGLFLLGWSQREAHENDFAWLPNSVIVNLPNYAYPVLAILFVLFAVAAAVASKNTRITRRLRLYEQWLVPAEVIISATALAGLTLGLYAGQPLVSDLPTGWAYAYFYGGSAFLLALWSLLVWDWNHHPLQAAFASITRRFRRLRNS